MSKEEPILFEMLSEEDKKKIRSAMVGYIRTHRDWYERSSATYGSIFNFGNVLIIAFGAAASILAAGNFDGPASKAAIVLLPALSSLIATILSQFRVRDIWRLREVGRIEAEALAARAMAIPVNAETDTYQEALKVRQLAHELERAQMAEFFSGTDSTNKIGNPQSQGPEPHPAPKKSSELASAPQVSGSVSEAQAASTGSVADTLPSVKAEPAEKADQTTQGEKDEKRG